MISKVPFQSSSQSRNATGRAHHWKADAVDQLQRETNAPDLGGEHQKINDQLGGKRDETKANPETLPQRIDQGMLAHRRQPAGHLHEKNHADRA